MRKQIIFWVVILLLIGKTIPAFAAVDSCDDLSALTDEIVYTVNDLYSDKLSRAVVEDDIDYDNAFQIYVGKNLFETDVCNVKEIPDLFGTDGYIYQLPIYIGGDTFIVNLAKGQPLNEDVEFTEEERNNVLEYVGEWQVTALEYYAQEIVNYETELQSKIEDVPKNVVLVGGLPYFRYAVALLADDEGDIYGLVPLSSVSGIEKIAAFNSDSDDNIYNYQEIKAYINQLPKESEDEAGGEFSDIDFTENTSNYGTFIFILVILVVGVIVIYTVWRKRA